MTSASTRPRHAPTVARWVPVTTFALSVIALGVSVYLTIEHYQGDKTLACPATGMIDCAAVTKSAYATPFGVPVALLGLLFFVVMTLLNTPPAWRRPALDTIRLLGLGVGALMVLWLVYVELFRLDKICLWCTSVHVITLAVIGVVALAGQRRDRPLAD